MSRPRVLLALALLYTAQGVPFGLAAEYLPVVLREAKMSYAAIAAVGWLQLPWQLKPLFAGVADDPRVRRRSRLVLLALQLGLTATLAAYAPFPVGRAWFVLTALAALFAAFQDVFVDALAVRALSSGDRGFGNVAQVAGYRLGMLLGGAGLLLSVATLGQKTTLLALAGLVSAASVGAFLAREEPGATEAPRESAPPSVRLGARALVRHLLGPEVRVVLAVALSFKFGLHVASGLLKPMVVDAGWSKREIGLAVVTVGTVCGLVGAGTGGLLHRKLGETRALVVAAVLQALSCVPLVVAVLQRCPRSTTTIAIGAEHFVSGVGTTILFASLMTATRRSDAGLHYTVLTSANAVAIGFGGLLGGLLADRLGLPTTFVVAAALCLAPLALLGRWTAAAVASAGETA